MLLLLILLHAFYLRRKKLKTVDTIRPSHIHEAIVTVTCNVILNTDRYAIIKRSHQDFEHNLFTSVSSDTMQCVHQ
jgi:hypothetical protein